MKKKLFTPYSSLDSMLGKPPGWWPEEEQQRIASYEKYDQLYWNDPTQYAIRVLENEQPIYVPNARTIVDTTAHYLLKGLTINLPSQDPKESNQKFWDDFCKRERFYSKFHRNKQSGVARGDWAFHITADPTKEEGSRISIDTLHPGMVWKVPHPDDPDDIIRIHIVQQWIEPNDDEKKPRIRKLTYHKIDKNHPDWTGTRRIARDEAIYEIEPTWHGPEPKLVRQILKYDFLPPEIDQFPVYWFNNIEWESQDYGSSEIRGLEFLDWAVSQGCTDTQMALGLEGLGVFATDGGRPVDDQGNETDWEVAPGKVMEVPSGAYFRRVDGVGSVTPMMEQLKYLESKMYQASAMTDVALGQVDVQVAQSGIALAIKFMPTLAKLEHRDTAGVEITQQMVHDLKKWFLVYERMNIVDDFDVSIAASKLPKNRTETVNELNNMLDRKVISKKYYREQMRELGYAIPDDIEKQIMEEAKEDAKRAALSAPPGLAPNAEAAAAGLPPESNPDNGRVDKRPNRSNNRSRSNESSGTESGQTLNRQSN